ncbi:ABCF5 [Symbiodinium sp. CCMP2456]|nr:ABCF5 [Symbiodinium sp. CCMP2456]
MAAKQKALQALQSLELAQKKEEDEAAAKKAARQKKNGREAAPVAAAVSNGKNGKTEAVQTIEKPKAEKSTKEADPLKNGNAKVTAEVSNGANGKTEVATAPPEEPAKMEEKEPAKMEDKEAAQEPTEVQEPEATEEVSKEDPEDMKAAEEVVEKMMDLEKEREAAAAPAAQETEAVDAPPAPAKKQAFTDILSGVDWDSIDNSAGNRDPDPFSAIGDIHAKAAEVDRKKQDKKKEIGGATKELDREEYFRRKGIDPRLGGTVDTELEDWADDPNYYPEEEEEDEEPVMIKRKRGADDQVDWSFLQKGDVEGEVTVGIREVAIRLGGRQVLQDASWTVKTGEKLALVGANGCGKTTQLRVLLNQLTPEKGEVVKSPSNAKVAILEQSFVDEMDPERTLKEELLSALPEQKAILDEKEEVEKALEANPEDPQEQMRLVDRLTELTTMEEEYGTYKLDDQLATIKSIAGFLDEDLDRKVGLFSGGWKVRIGVSKLFMSSPDILLLDEPTNHLDLEAVEWIESFIKSLQNPVVVVTHDREFMNRTCNRVVETVEGMTYSYEGNYTAFIKQKEQKMILWKKKWDLQVTPCRWLVVAGLGVYGIGAEEKKRKELQDFIKQNRGVQSLANTRQKRMKARHPWSSELEELTQWGAQYLQYPRVKRISFRRTPQPGDKIGIIGGNGKGKHATKSMLKASVLPA